jgi:tetratricopeptide (TPR) repeat protein
MRNWIRCSGVYSNMVRVLLFLVCWLAALAQQMPQQDPLDTAIQAAWQASGAVGREQALALLQRKPVDSPRFAGWAQQVAQTYQNAGLNGQARAILQEALARTSRLGDSQLSHIAMLSLLGESWWQDGNLLKGVGYLEQAATAQAAAPAGPPAQLAMRTPLG